MKMATPISSEDLDQLLDSVLEDFCKLNLSSIQFHSLGNQGLSSTSTIGRLGPSVPEIRHGRKGKGKGRAHVRAPVSDSSSTSSSYAAEALERLAKETREAIRGIDAIMADEEFMEAFDDNTRLEEFIMEIRELAGPEDMEIVFENMMRQLLTKETLHEPMKEIASRYPKWLEENRHELGREEYSRYHKQYKLMLKLNAAYETDPENFSKIADIVSKLQACGQAPDEIVREIAPELDLAILGQFSPEKLDSAQNCSFM